MFYHEERNIRAAVHGDDFTVSGKSEDFDWLRNVVEKKMEVKHTERLIRGHEGVVRLLNRVVSSTREGFYNEADQRQAEIIMRDVG